MASVSDPVLDSIPSALPLATPPTTTVTTASTATAKKSLPLPWTPVETAQLIQAYQEKWYSLKRGQLKASQWEEVAVSVAARCGYEEPTKSATQCRHKIEKLRKRYRSERLRPQPSAWQFFDLMDRLERGSLPIAARPIAALKLDDRQNPHENFTARSRSINYIIRAPPGGAENGGGDHKKLSNLRNPMFRRPRKMAEEEVVAPAEGGRGMLAELAAEIRTFAERFVQLENKKMEMMRETERCRMEMENKRIGMILESQRKIVDTISRSIGSHKKLKIAQEL